MLTTDMMAAVIPYATSPKTPQQFLDERPEFDTNLNEVTRLFAEIREDVLAHPEFAWDTPADQPVL